MHPDAATLLWDASTAGHLVEDFIAGQAFDQYEIDALLRSAVERQLGIVGEALNKLSKVDAATASEITDLPRIVGFRNVLVHGYATVDNLLVWQIVAASLPRLLREVDALLADPAGD
jgi:uncharacterized protein with HEPN domain